MLTKVRARKKRGVSNLLASVEQEDVTALQEKHRVPVLVHAVSKVPLYENLRPHNAWQIDERSFGRKGGRV